MEHTATDTKSEGARAMPRFGEATVFQLGEESSRVALAQGELQLTTGEHATTLEVRVTPSGGDLTSDVRRKLLTACCPMGLHGAPIYGPGLHTLRPDVLCAEAVAWKTEHLGNV